MLEQAWIAVVCIACAISTTVCTLPVTLCCVEEDLIEEEASSMDGGGVLIFTPLLREGFNQSNNEINLNESANWHQASAISTNRSCNKEQRAYHTS